MSQSGAHSAVVCWCSVTVTDGNLVIVAHRQHHYLIHMSNNKQWDTVSTGGGMRQLPQDLKERYRPHSHA